MWYIEVREVDKHIVWITELKPGKFGITRSPDEAAHFSCTADCYAAFASHYGYNPIGIQDVSFRKA